MELQNTLQQQDTSLLTATKEALTVTYCFINLLRTVLDDSQQTI